MLPRPRMVGRTLRIVLALALFGLLVNLLRQAPEFLGARRGWQIPGGDWWVAAAICLYALPGMIDDLFGYRFGRWTQAGYLSLLVAAIALDWLAYGLVWAPPLSLLVLALFVYVLVTAG
ncbi:MAG TPA: hypothetical protein VMW65_00380, partial [Chloroflexota bacterium]|nr:hypothetical protein [Chloroflexota bacterium]